MLLRVLLVIQPPKLCKRFARLCAQPDVLVSALPGRASLVDGAQHQNSDLILVSLAALPEPWHDTFSALQKLPDQPEVVVLTEGEDAEQRGRLLAQGCMAVVNQGLPDAVLAETLAALLHRRQGQTLDRLHLARGEASRLSDFISASPAMEAFMRTVRRVVATDTSLLILGETGVGKERLASAIHLDSPRSAGPFVAVNCGALSEGVVESELFGHEEGAFTGASRPRRGYFELAHNGTIFLDEIGEITPGLQVKLLRVLQERVIQRVGSEKTIPLDVRVMAATNRDLLEEVQAKRFRQDLYYRLGVVTLTVPPLRERPEDIPLLAESYVRHFRQRLGRDVRGITPEAVRGLCTYPWPGNVRELINVIERAVLLCAGPEITLADLPNGARGKGPALDGRPGGVPGPGLVVPDDWLARPWEGVRKEALARLERAYLDGLLRATAGRIGETARRAGMQPRSLYEKMRQHGLRKETYRTPPEACPRSGPGRLPGGRPVALTGPGGAGGSRPHTAGCAG